MVGSRSTQDCSSTTGRDDVFFYDCNNPVQPFSEISFTPYANESHPQAFTDSTYTYLSDASGIVAQYEGSLERKKVGDRVKYVYTIEEELGEIDSVILDPGIELSEALPKSQTLKEVKRQETVPVYKMQGENHLFKQYNLSIQELSVGRREQIEHIVINGEPSFLLEKIDYTYTKSTANSVYMDKFILLNSILFFGFYYPQSIPVLKGH